MLIFLSLTSFALGSWAGWAAAKQGLTADNALKQYQRQVHWSSSFALLLGTFSFIILTTGRHHAWLPSFLLLYIGAYFWYVALSICCCCAGFLLFLERSGWKNRQRLQQLALFLVVNLLGVAVLLHQNLPITGLVKPTRVLDGVVLQTTSYSCSAATIATLSRLVNPTWQTTEQEVVRLASTSRQGTSTLAEIRALRALGLEPQYERHLSIADLIARGQMAVLHVKEPVAGSRIAHAIALLSIDSETSTLTVANPLYGKQTKTFDDMKDYWLEDAVFTQVLRLP